MKSPNPADHSAVFPKVVQVIDTQAQGLELPIVQGKGAARAVLWPGNGARFRSFHVISLGRGACTVDLSHPSDCVYYVIDGAGAILDLNTGERTPLAEGAMVHIDAYDKYRLQCDGDAVRLLGGPCPPDPAFYASAQSPASAQKEA